MDKYITKSLQIRPLIPTLTSPPSRPHSDVLGKQEVNKLFPPVGLSCWRFIFIGFH